MSLQITAMLIGGVLFWAPTKSTVIVKMVSSAYLLNVDFMDFVQRTLDSHMLIG